MIFGQGYAIITSSDDAGATFNNYEILSSKLIPNYEQRKEMENISPINGNRNFNTLYTHMEFRIIVELHLWDDPKAALIELAGLLDHDVYLKPHKYKQDGITPANYLEDNNSDDEVFHCTKLKPDGQLNDRIEIILKSTTPMLITDTIF